MKLASIVLIAAGLLLPCYAQLQQQQEPSVIPPNPKGPTTSRIIQGVVRNESGAPVPGAIILLKDMKTLQVRSFIAQQDGQYHFYGLSMDVNYELRAEHDGMTSKTKTVNVFNSHKLVQVDLRLDKKMKS